MSKKETAHVILDPAIDPDVIRAGRYFRRYLRAMKIAEYSWGRFSEAWESARAKNPSLPDMVSR